MDEKTLFEHTNVCKSSCILYIVLFSIIFTINVGIGTYFVYYKYINHDKETFVKEGVIFQTTVWTYKWSIKQIDINSRAYYLFHHMINIDVFDTNLLKQGKNPYKNTDIYYIGYITIIKEKK